VPATIGLTFKDLKMTDKPIFSDDFANGIDSAWTWLREDPALWRLDNGGLEICVQPGTAGTAINALLFDAPDRKAGDFSVEVTVHNHTLPTIQYEQAGITLYVDDLPVFKLVKELIDGDLYIIPGKKAMPTQSVRLRLLVKSNSWEAQYRQEGATEFSTADSGDLPVGEKTQVSLQCYNGPPNSDHWIRFEDLRITKLP
jgi:regulation of enolase protein 1 (concanavalin A-like superfamily)